MVFGKKGSNKQAADKSSSAPTTPSKGLFTEWAGFVQNQVDFGLQKQEKSQSTAPSSSNTSWTMSDEPLPASVPVPQNDVPGDESPSFELPDMQAISLAQPQPADQAASAPIQSAFDSREQSDIVSDLFAPLPVQPSEPPAVEPSGLSPMSDEPESQEQTISEVAGYQEILSPQSELEIKTDSAEGPVQELPPIVEISTPKASSLQQPQVLSHHMPVNQSLTEPVVPAASDDSLLSFDAAVKTDDGLAFGLPSDADLLEGFGETAKAESLDGFGSLLDGFSGSDDLLSGSEPDSLSTGLGDFDFADASSASAPFGLLDFPGSTTDDLLGSSSVGSSSPDPLLELGASSLSNAGLDFLPDIEMTPAPPAAQTPVPSKMPDLDPPTIEIFEPPKVASESAAALPEPGFKADEDDLTFSLDASSSGSPALSFNQSEEDFLLKSDADQAEDWLWSLDEDDNASEPSLSLGSEQTAVDDSDLVLTGRPEEPSTDLQAKFQDFLKDTVPEAASVTPSDSNSEGGFVSALSVTAGPAKASPAQKSDISDDAEPVWSMDAGTLSDSIDTSSTDLDAFMVGDVPLFDPFDDTGAQLDPEPAVINLEPPKPAATVTRPESSPPPPPMPPEQVNELLNQLPQTITTGEMSLERIRSHNDAIDWDALMPPPLANPPAISIPAVSQPAKSDERSRTEAPPVFEDRPASEPAALQPEPLAIAEPEPELLNMPASPMAELAEASASSTAAETNTESPAAAEDPKHDFVAEAKPPEGDDLTILRSTTLDSGQAIYFVHADNTYALMGQTDDGMVTVKLFGPENPMATMPSFLVTLENQVMGKAVYLAQVGTWQGVISTDNSTMTLTSEYFM